MINLTESQSAHPIYQDKCKKLLQEKDIRFAGIVNAEGRLVSGGFKEGIIPFEGDEKKLRSFMEIMAQVSLPKEYDKALGPINYLAARRDKVVLVSFPFPVSRILLLVSAETTVDIEQLSARVVDIFTDFS